MNVLFVCNGNVARSQEAEVFFNNQSRNHRASSAGINVKVGKPIDPSVVTVMNELGYSMQSAVRKTISSKLVNNAEIIISFKPYSELPEFMQTFENIRFWGVPDPQHQPIEFHRQVRDDVKKRVAKLVSEIEN